MKKQLGSLALAAALIASMACSSALATLIEADIAYRPTANEYMAVDTLADNDLNCRVVDAYGEVVGSVINVTTAICRHPSIAYDGDLDRFLVVWGELNSDTSEYAVKGRIVTPSGELVGSELILDDGITADWPEPKVVYSPHTQRYLVVFSNYSSIEAQYVNGDGTLYGLNFDALPGNSKTDFLYAQHAGISYDGVNHHFLVTGMIYGNGSSATSQYAAMVADTDAISMYKSPFPVYDSGSYLYPVTPAFDAVNQRFMLVWEVYFSDGHELWGQLVNADGTLEGEHFVIKQDRTPADANDVIYKPGDGRFLVAWLDWRGSSGLTIYAQEVDPSGTNYGSEFLLAAPAFQYDVALAYNTEDQNSILAYRGIAWGSTDEFVVTPPPTPPITHNLIITPAEGTTGTVIDVEGDGFGPDKGSISLVGLSKTYKLTVLTWNEGGNGHITASLKKAPPVGTYDVVVQPKAKGSAAITEEDGFTVEPPEITSSPASGSVGDQLTITGDCFGTKKGKVLLSAGGNAKPKNCKVISWPSDSASGTESGTITFVVPKGLAAGDLVLTVDNSLGQDTAAFTLLP